MAGGFAASIYRCSPVEADIKDDPNHLYDPFLPSVSDRHRKPFSTGFCGRGTKPSQESRLSSVGAWYSCLLSAVFEDCHDQKEEREEAVIQPDIEKTRVYYRNLVPENICSCDYRWNYCARVKEAYPKVAFYLDALGGGHRKIL